MDVTPLAPVIGAEIAGIDWSRGIELAPEQHVALGERSGEVEVHSFFPNLGAGTRT